MEGWPRRAIPGNGQDPLAAEVMVAVTAAAQEFRKGNRKDGSVPGCCLGAHNRVMHRVRRKRRDDSNTGMGRFADPDKGLAKFLARVSPDS
jgi:hypothetical protein